MNPLYISNVSIKNLRCFEDINLDFNLNESGDYIPWNMIVGDNSTGKSCLLKALAIGICDQSSAAALIRESDEGYVSRWAEIDAQTSIKIELRRKDDPIEYIINTSINKVGENASGSVTEYFHELVTQETTPNFPNFPWGDIFACGYGPSRGTSGTGDISGYSVINAVYNMFNYNEGLQNPELAIRRIRDKYSSSDKDIESEVLKLIQRILTGHLTSNSKYIVGLEHSGLTVGGPWGERMPLRDLADGFRSTCIWITDFLGWALSYYPEIDKLSDISGIVFIDEIDQHLHPKWQKTIVKDLKREFPKIQFITTTHSPLIASSLSSLVKDNNLDKLIHLKLLNERSTMRNLINEIEGLDIDQVLASGAFDYVLKDDDPELDTIFRITSELASKGEERDFEEDELYNKYKAILKRALQPGGKTKIERELIIESFKDMKDEVARLENKLFGKLDD